MIISPSILSADFAFLHKDIDLINQSKNTWFHLDIMDGSFVPNISFGIPIIEAVRRHTSKILDVHLMIEKPENYLQEIKKAGADSITIHLENSYHLHRNVEIIKELGAKAGVAINPHTPVYFLQDICQNLDLVLLMSVNPGFGGQLFIENTFRKISQLLQLRQEKKANFLIQIDGGVNLTNFKALKKAGVDILVIGNAIFKASNPSEALTIFTS